MINMYLYQDSYDYPGLLRITSSKHNGLEQGVLLDTISYDELSGFKIFFGTHVPPVNLKIDPISYNSCLYFWIDSTSCVEYDFCGLIPDVTTEERLTLAYL